MKQFIKKALISTIIAFIWALYCTYFGNVVISHMALRCLFAGVTLAILSEVT